MARRRLKDQFLDAVKGGIVGAVCIPAYEYVLIILAEIPNGAVLVTEFQSLVYIQAISLNIFPILSTFIGLFVAYDVGRVPGVLVYIAAGFVVPTILYHPFAGVILLIVMVVALIIAGYLEHRGYAFQRHY